MNRKAYLPKEFNKFVSVQTFLKDASGKVLNYPMHMQVQVLITSEFQR